MGKVSKNGKKTRAKKADALRHGAVPCGTEYVTRGGPEANLEAIPAEILEMIGEAFSPKTRESLRAASKKVREKVSEVKPAYAWIVEFKKHNKESKFEVFLNSRKAKEYFETMTGKKLDPIDLERFKHGLIVADYSQSIGNIVFYLSRGSLVG